MKTGCKVEVRENMRGGDGAVTIASWLTGEDLPAYARLMGQLTLPEGASIGDHAHNGESETFFILRGSGTYNDNGQNVDVKAGDVLLCKSGEVHGIRNTGKGDLVFAGVILLDPA